MESFSDRFHCNLHSKANKLGSGAFGQVVKGFDAKNQRAVAIKLEANDSKYPQVVQEARLYRILEDDLGIPQVYWVGEYSQKYTAMVMDCLGASLEDLFQKCGKEFSLKTVLMIADQVIQRVEYMHQRGYLHRDIKPDNFLIGVGSRAHYIHLIDLGLAKTFKV